MAEADPKVQSPKAVQLSPAFAVRVDAFMRVKAFISTELTRYYLNGVFVQRCPDGGALCVATDGHRMGVRRDQGGISNTPTIARVPGGLKLPTKAELKTYRGSMPWLVCFSDGARGHLSLVAPAISRDDDTAETAIANADNCIMRWGNVVIDGEFPEWRRVMPAVKPTGNVVGFNSALLGSFGNAIEISGDADPSSPRVIQDASDRDFFGILMPMRTDAGAMPGWVKDAA